MNRGYHNRTIDFEMVDSWLLGGFSNNAIAKVSGHCVTTVSKRRKYLKLTGAKFEPCRCGKEAGHPASCALKSGMEKQIVLPGGGVVEVGSSKTASWARPKAEPKRRLGPSLPNSDFIANPTPEQLRAGR